MKTLVISYYNEDLSWLDNVKCEQIIYNKGQNKPNRFHINLPNVGREAGTYLTHIITNYNDLNDINIFAQGNPFDHCHDIVERINSTCDVDNVTWLGSNWGPVTKNYEGGPGSIPLPLLSICEELFNESYDNSKTFTFSAGAQYMVPKKFIVNKSLEWWNHCYFIFDKYIDTSPWAYERIWPMIWNYSTNH